MAPSADSGTSNGGGGGGVVATPATTIAPAHARHATDVLVGKAGGSALVKSAEVTTTAAPPDCACDAPGGRAMAAPARKTTVLEVNDKLPTAKALDECAGLPLFGGDGRERSFASVVEGDGTKDKNMLIFIRHFFCGVCQAYVSTLSKDLPPTALPSDTTITIIGCGYPDLIPNYAKATSCAYPIYCDPTERLHDALKLTASLELGPRKPKYMRDSVLTATLKSMAQILSWSAGRYVNRAGSWSQLGGEFLFTRDAAPPGRAWGVAWAHRMRNTRDHVEVPHLRRVLCNSGGTGGAAVHSTDDGEVKVKDFATASRDEATREKD